MRKIFTPPESCKLLLIILVMGTDWIHAQQIAFPGAEGFGKYASGGRGGHIVKVTNLLDDPDSLPEGSLRWALEQGMDTVEHPVTGQPVPVPGRLTVVFRVSGIIELQAELNVNRDDLTIAGQSAPGDGICLKNHVMTVRGKNIIIRYLRFRPGLGAGTTELAKGIAGLDVENCQHVMVDHCSFGWANEECAIFYDNHYTTVQWCIASEGLYDAEHAKGVRSYGGVWGGQKASIHHNLIAHNYSRTIRFNGSRAHDTAALVDYRNNVIYNWGRSGACYGGEVQIPGGYSRSNMVGNYYRPGPATDGNHLFIEPSYPSGGNTGVGRWYINGNIMYTSESKTNDNWLGVDLHNIPAGSRDAAKSTSPFRMEEPLPTETAEEAYLSVLGMAGAVYPKRDTVDARIIQETLNGTASGTGTVGNGIIDTPAAVGGYPEYLTYGVPEDGDEDGMDDEWETANGLDPSDPDDRNDVHASGYTMLEMYLNGLVEDFTQVLDPVVHIKRVQEAYCVGSAPSWMLGSPRGGQFRGDSAFTVFGDSVVFNLADTGHYTLKYVYSDGMGFSDSITEILTVHPLPQASVTGLDTAYTVGDSYVTLTGDPGGGTFLPGPELIVTPSGAIFKPNTAGDYEVFYEYTDVYGCTVLVSARTTVYPATGLDGGASAPGIRLFPNPAGNLIRIQSPVPPRLIRIHDLAGRRIREIRYAGDEPIPLNDLGRGIYLMQIITDEGTAVRKFVRN